MPLPCPLHLTCLQQRTTPFSRFSYIPPPLPYTPRASCVRPPNCELCRAALFKLVQDHWSPSTVYCDEVDTEPGFGVVIMTHSFGMATDGPLVRFADSFGAPVHVSASQLFVAARAQAGAIYAVPDSCVFRLGSSPLQVVVKDPVTGLLDSRAPDRVAAKYVPRSTFRRTEIAVRWKWGGGWSVGGGGGGRGGGVGGGWGVRGGGKGRPVGPYLCIGETVTGPLGVPRRGTPGALAWQIW